jgi:hypothetical protein
MKILTIQFQKEPKILTLWHYQQVFSHLLDIVVKKEISTDVGRRGSSMGNS